MIEVTTEELEKLLRERIARIAGIELSVGFDKPIFVSILGPDAGKLTETRRLFRRV